MDSTPMDLMPTLSLIGEFERSMSAINHGTDHEMIALRGIEALIIWEELKRRGAEINVPSE